MFDIGWSELLVVAVLAIIFIGPRDLPKALATVGRWTAKARAVANEFRSSLDEMAREAEVAEIKKNLESAAKVDLGINPHNILDGSGAARDISGIPAAEAAAPTPSVDDAAALPSATPPPLPEATERAATNAAAASSVSAEAPIAKPASEASAPEPQTQRSGA